MSETQRESRVRSTHWVVPPRVSQMRGRVASLDRQTRKVASDHPLWTLVAAVAIGYLAGRIAVRR